MKPRVKMFEAYHAKQDRAELIAMLVKVAVFGAFCWWAIEANWLGIAIDAYLKTP
jgi:hypothetical protein